MLIDMPYLKEVIADVLENYPDKIDRLVFVTTGKRPALFLKKYLFLKKFQIFFRQFFHCYLLLV